MVGVREVTVHIFNVDDAVNYGVEKAIILQNMRFWLDKNRANGTNLHDGYYWTFNSVEAYLELFPYLKSVGIIQRLLKGMEEDGLLLVGRYNKKGYDRTKWYSMPEYTDKSLDNSHSPKITNGNIASKIAIHQKQRMVSPKTTNGFANSGEPIPDVNTDNKPDVNTDNINEKEKMSFDDFWNAYGKKVDTSKCKAKWGKLTDDDKQAIMNNVADYVSANSDRTYRKNPLTYLNGKCWLDDIICLEPQQPTANSQQPINNFTAPDVYHPSYESVSIDTAPSKLASDSWTWKEPLPNMSIPETHAAVKKYKTKRENVKACYDRMYNNVLAGREINHE